MKKRIMLIIIAMMMLSLCSCGNAQTDSLNTENNTSASNGETEGSAIKDDRDALETISSSDRALPDGLVEIYVSAGNAADFVFHADKSSVDDFKTISYRFGDFDIKLSDFGEGYQSSTWKVSDGQAEFAEEEDYVIDGSDYIIRTYITSIVPSFDTKDGTYELYFESRDGQTYYYDLVWKDVIRQGKYEEQTKNQTEEMSSAASDVPYVDLWYLDKRLTDDSGQYCIFSSPDENGFPTQMKFKGHWIHNGDGEVLGAAYGETFWVEGSCSIKNLISQEYWRDEIVTSSFFKAFYVNKPDHIGVFVGEFHDSEGHTLGVEIGNRDN